jgi:beta-glucosidase
MSGQFPEGFLWGASTAAHQIEGGNVNSDWWALEHAGAPLIKEPSGDALDSYHRWPEDMDLLATEGFTDYRFSIEWARIEPAPGEFSQAQLEHYRSMIQGALSRGLRPMVTLHHFTSPVWFAEAGGWRAPDSVARFAAYVEAVLPVLDGVERVCTINEPNIVGLLAAAVEADWTLNLDALEVLPHGSATQHLITAHQEAGRHLKARWPDLLVGWAVSWPTLVAQPGAESVMAQLRQSRQGVFAEAGAGDDWIGVQTYTRNFIGVRDGRPITVPPPEGAELTTMGWEFYPPAVGDAVREVADLLPHVPIIVTENGVATGDDERRIAYLDGALTALAAAIADGVDVRGYYCWSLLDNYEWGSYAPTFGLVAVDRKTFVRSPKPSLAWLGARRPS